MARGQTPFCADRLVAARRAVGMSQAALAAAVGCTRQQIIAYERGRNRPEMPRIRALAGAVGVAPADLIAPAQGTTCELPDSKEQSSD